MGQGMPKQRLHLSRRQPWQPVRKPPNRTTGEPTGGDLLKPLHRTINVQGQAVLGDPATTTHTDGGDLAVVQAGAGHARRTLTLQAQLRQNIQNDLFQLTQIPVQIGPAALKVQHRVGHELAGQVMGHLPAPIDPVQGCRWLSGIEMQVLLAGTTAEGVAGLVLKDPDRLRSRWISQKAALPTLLRRPSGIESNRISGLVKKCSPGVGRIVRRI